VKRPTNAKSLIKLLANILYISSYFTVVALFLGYASLPGIGGEQYQHTIQTHPLTGDPEKHKSIFVFLDGTANDPRSGTNVWQLYNILLENNDPQMTATYIEGVGSVDKPIFGGALGRGMEERMLRGYEFITHNYNLGDDIYIFGFSRGAHEARSLAGMLSYAGVPATSSREHDNLLEIGNGIFELAKKKSDEDYLDEWSSWKPNQLPLLATEIEEKLNLGVQTVQVTFLGLWDTVPGSSLKDYGDCEEKKGFIKKYLHWLVPGVDKGERYKSGSYPAIRQIAHAVSIDEKRSKFAPLLICSAINARYTKINEVWFPGAHADVGGGYEDSDELPRISLEWMIGLLNESYMFSTTAPQVKGNAKGLAHWSIGDFPANIGSKCVDRQPGASAKLHKSYYERKESSPVPIRWEGGKKYLTYPIECSTL